jgi:cytidylate kinase
VRVGQHSPRDRSSGLGRRARFKAAVQVDQSAGVGRNPVDAQTPDRPRAMRHASERRNAQDADRTSEPALAAGRVRRGSRVQAGLRMESAADLDDPDVRDNLEVVVENRRFTIAIDGPAAAGKSTVGELVARHFDAVYFDTGILYRALTLVALRHGIALDDAAALATCARTLDIRLAQPSVADGRQADILLDEEDVTSLLRTPEVDRAVSEVSAHREVRAALLDLQRAIGRCGRVVMVGRDIGTIVLPDAELKVYLDASPEERARRRCEQLALAQKPVPYGDVLEDMYHRDRIDSLRDVAPLRPAADALVIDSDRLAVSEVVERIVAAAESRLAALPAP